MKLEFCDDYWCVVIIGDAFTSNVTLMIVLTLVTVRHSVN